MIKKAAYRLSRSVREYYYSVFPDSELVDRLESRPPALAIETINACNANCIFCGYQYQERPKKVMKEETFRKSVDDYVALGGGNLAIAVVVGDPLLDPNFIERVQYARRFPEIAEIATTTNLLHLQKTGTERLLTSGITTVCISTTGFDPKMYERLFRSKRYDEMKANLLDLLRTNRKIGRPVKIIVSLRIDKPSEEVFRYPGFEEVLQLADRVDSNSYFDSWSGRIKSEDLTGNMKIRPQSFFFMKKRAPCSQLYTGIGVLVDGTVTACACRDLNGDSDLVLGNINRSSLALLWDSPHLNTLRKDWFEKRKLPNICVDCTHYNPYTYLMLAEVRDRL